MQETHTYEVVLHVLLPPEYMERAVDGLPHADEAEPIGSGTLRVVENVVARTKHQAYRRAVNVTTAQLDAGDVNHGSVSAASIGRDE